MSRVAFWLAVALFATVYWLFAPLIADITPYLILGDCYAAADPDRCEHASLAIKTGAFVLAGALYSVLLWWAVCRFYRRGS